MDKLFEYCFTRESVGKYIGNLIITAILGGATFGRMLHDPFPGYSLDSVLAAEMTWFLMAGNKIYETATPKQHKLPKFCLAISPAVAGSGIECLQYIGTLGGVGMINDFYSYLAGSLFMYTGFRLLPTKNNLFTSC